MNEPQELSMARLAQSEARFRAAVSAVGVMWTNDASGRMMGEQPGWAELTGQSEAEYQGYGWASAIHPEDAQPTIDAWNRAVADKRVFEFRHRVLRRDKAWRTFSVRAVPVVAGHEIVEWVGVHVDITESARAIEDLTASELRSKNILESITDGFFTLDRQWRFDYVNPEAERILGCEPGALLGQVLWEVYPGTVGTVFEHTYRRVAAREEAESFLAFYPDHGRWYDVRAFPHPNGVSVYFRDVTDAKQAETALRASEERRRLALDSAELGAWNVDAASGRLIADERFCIIFSGAPGPLDYPQAMALIHPEDRPRVVEAIEAATRASNPAAYAIEYRVVHPDGQLRWVFAKGRANFEGEGSKRHLASFDGTVADITERRRAEDELRRFASELSEADRRKDEFLATLAHELRNPLAPIRNGLQLLRLRDHAAPAAERTVAMMDRQVAQMIRLVDDLLDVSRISRDQLRLQKEQVGLSTILAQAIESSRPAITAGHHEVIVRAPTEPVMLNADLTRLVQVFANLLNNAAKFSPPRSKIQVTAELVDDARLIVRVKDEGIGIPSDMVQEVFEMFVQVDRSLERLEGGLGIGLTLVKKLVELHDGSVEAKSEGVGQGSEFVVRLPAMRSKDSASESSAGEEPAPSTMLKILVADDNKDAAETLSEILTLTGNDVRQANDGLEAVRLATEFQPDILVLDIGMPKLNGFGVCRRVREQSWGKQSVLIALTGWGQEADRKQSREAGFDHHLVKPVDIGVLTGLIGDVRRPPGL